MTPLTAASRFLIGEIVLIDVLALFLAVATVYILWFVVKKSFPDEVRHLQFFLTFIVVVVPFVMFIYFGLALIHYDAVATSVGWPLTLPLTDSLPPPMIGATAFYIGQTVWLWWSWRRLRIPR